MAQAHQGGALWGHLCGPCHGLTGAGDGPAAAFLPGPPAPLAGGANAIAANPTALRALLQVGRPERGMPAFSTLPAAQVEALVAHVGALAASAPTASPAPWLSGARRPPLPAVSAGTPPILAERSAVQCGRCHPGEADAWAGSRHAAAMGPGVVGQLHGSEALRDRCDGCHAPLAEQAGSLDPQLAAEGVTCTACHLDEAGQKVGGPAALHGRQPSTGIAVRRDARLWRSDFCLPCHQLPARADAPPPLLDTWREWAASPYLPADLQCQHCHLPGADHRILGVHDPATVRRAVRLAVLVVETTGKTPGETAGEVRVTSRVHNVGAGHHFPTTATPRAVLRVRQLGPPEGEAGTGSHRGGVPLGETEHSWALGRTLAASAAAPGGLVTVADTRIPAGGVAERDYRWRRHPQATAVEVSLWMFPDWHYDRVFGAALGGALGAAERQDLAQAAAVARASGFEVDRVVWPLSEAGSGPPAAASSPVAPRPVGPPPLGPAVPGPAVPATSPLR